MNDAAFHPYGLSHWIAMGCTVAVAVAAVLAGRRSAGRRHARAFTRVLRVAVILSIVPRYYLKIAIDGMAPLELCDLAGVVAIVCLFTQQRFVSALIFYWGLTLTPQAILTPDLRAGFPSLRFLVFFVSHGAVFVAAAYSTWGRPARITWGLYRAVLAITVLLALTMMVVNAKLGTNYMYVSAKPPGGSVLDVLGPWPFYVAVEIGLAAGLWALITWPFAAGKAIAGGAAGTRPPRNSPTE
jgi:hypothetical integral membrane protein (TIGR02206 family)